MTFIRDLMKVREKPWGYLRRAFQVEGTACAKTEAETCRACSRTSKRTSMNDQGRALKWKGQWYGESTPRTLEIEKGTMNGRVGHMRILHFILSEMGNLWRVFNTYDLKRFLIFTICNNSEHPLFYPC